MKKLILSITLALAAVSGYSQEEKVGFVDGVKDVYDTAKTSGLFDATNYAYNVYGTYAPDAPKGDKVGGGIFVAYNINKFTAMGFGVDYLGEFSLVTGNIGLQLPFKPFARFGLDGWNPIRDLEVVPFVRAGVGRPLGGTGGSDVTVTEGKGMYLRFGNLWGGKFQTGVDYGSWINAGPYSGTRWHIFAGWGKDF